MPIKKVIFINLVTYVHHNFSLYVFGTLIDTVQCLLGRNLHKLKRYILVLGWIKIKGFNNFTQRIFNKNYFSKYVIPHVVIFVLQKKQFS